MAYFNINPLIRTTQGGSVNDASVRPDSVKYIYRYATADLASVVEVAGYFPATMGLNVGDTIGATMNAGVGATPVLKHYVVTVASPVTLALQTVTAG